jgi:ABC-type molybdate transport system substrate-binding protein
MLIPAYADWNIRFAANQMALCYTDKSRHASEISAENWYEVLQKKDVVWGHSDPNLDPCGYRSLMVLQLAEKHYGIPGLNDKLLANRPQENVRPKSVELISLLQSANMGYALFPQLTVANNITYGLRYRRHDREAAKKSIRRLVDDLGIVDLGFLYELNVAVLDTMFRSHVTKGSAVDLGLDIGTEVQVSFKASAVHTF